jgi:hypothetical protein
MQELKHFSPPLTLPIKGELYKMTMIRTTG